VLRVCNEFDFRVPDDIAVIGIDDDPVICQMCTPTLSSIGANVRAIGYRAAAMLHGMITRGESPPPVTFVEPGSVQPRASTAMLAVADADVAAAMRFLREHACEPITIPHVATTLGISRHLRNTSASPPASIAAPTALIPSVPSAQFARLVHDEPTTSPLAPRVLRRNGFLS
jgi:LacI family transcriptional regulator